MTHARPSSSAYVGVAYMLGATTVFAVQDGVSKLLVVDHSPIFLAMIRYWAFAAFVVALSASRPGGLPRAVRTTQPLAQVARGLLLVCQIVLVTYSFGAVGLAETHAVMAAYPLLVAAGGAALLGERVALLNWIAIAIGAVGVVVIVAPGLGAPTMGPEVFAPLGCAVGFASYNLLTRWVGAYDSPSTSFFYLGVVGAAATSAIGPFYWSSLQGADWGWMGLLCVTGAGAHYLLIKAFEHAEAARLQPYAYWQTLLASAIGVVAFSEIFRTELLLGGALVIAGGLAGAMLRRRPA